MNEQAIQDAYNLFVQTGYKGDINAFSNLIKTNPNALNDSYNLFVDNGYNKGYDEYKTLVGVNQAQGADLLKKKGQGTMAQMVPKTTTESFVEESLSASQPKAQVAPKQKPGILAQPVPQNTTESFLATASAEPSIQPIGAKKPTEVQAPQPIKEKNYFQGDFGALLNATDVITPFGLGEFIDDMGRAINAGNKSAAFVTPSNQLLLKSKNYSPETLKKFYEAGKEMDNVGPSDEMQKFRKFYDETGGGFLGFIKAITFHPDAIPEILVNSYFTLANASSAAAAAPVLATGAATGIGGGLPGMAIGMARSIPYAMGAASTVMETGLTFGELLKDELANRKLDWSEDNIKTLLEDEKFVSSIRGKAAARGVTIGLIDAMTGKIAGRVGAKILTKGTKAARVQAGVAAATLESGGGSLGEAAGRLVAGQEMDEADIYMEGIANLPMAAPAIMAEVLNKPIYKINGERVTENDVKDIVDNTPVAELGKINFEFTNDRSGYKKIVQDKVVTHATKEQVREANPDLNEPSLDAITKLELDLQKLQGNTTQTGKDKAAALRGQIKGIQENQLQAEAAQQNELGAAYRSQRISDAEKALAQPENKKGTVTIDDKEVKRTELEKELETLKTEQNAIQEQTAGQVPVQSETGTRLQVAEGEPQAEPQGVTQEVEAEEVEKRRQEELDEYEGRRAAEFVKLNKEGANKELTEDEVNEVEEIIQAAIDNGNVTAEKLFKMLQGQGYVYSAYGTPTSTLAYLKNRLNGKTDVKVGGNLIDNTNAKYDAELAALEQPAPQENQAQVETLRAQEQTELMEAIPNAAQYVVDGKVDRTKISDPNDLKTFDEIYDKYDKLITPLLPTTEVATTTSATQDQRKNALRELMQATGDDVFISGTEDGTFAGEGLLNVDSDGNVVLTRHAESEGDLVKSGQVTSPEDLRNLTGVFGGEQVATSGVEGGLQSFKSGVIGEYKIPLAELVKLMKDGYVTFAGLGNKEFVLSPHIAQQYLSNVKDSSGKVIKENQVSSKTQTTKTKQNEQVQSKRRGDGGISNKGREITPLEGSPNVPDANLVSIAEQYAKENGIDLKRQSEYVEVDEKRAKRIADAYDKMANDPQNPKVKEAYQELIKQTRAQYDALIKAGYEFTFFDDETDPYNESPNAAMRALRNYKKMAVYGTFAGYGTKGITDSEVENNPLLADTGLRWKDQNGKEQVVTANDLFRAVHDAFGHGLEGAGFRARGEENAWQAHARLFTGPAIGALTSETRGQNSWLNFGPYGEKNRTAKVSDTVFAENKIGLMPEWTWTEGRANDMEVEVKPTEKKAPAKKEPAKKETAKTEPVQVDEELKSKLKEIDGLYVKMSKDKNAYDKLKELLGVDFFADGLNEQQKEVFKSLRYFAAYLNPNNVRYKFKNINELVSAYQKNKEKGIDSELVKAVDTLIKAQTEAAKGAAKAEAVVEDLLDVDVSQKDGLDKVFGFLDSLDNNIKKELKKGLNDATFAIPLGIVQQIVKGLKVLVKGGMTLRDAIRSMSKETDVPQETIKDIIAISPIQEEFNALMAKVDTLIARQKSKNVTEAKIISNVDTFIRNSDVYKAADDAQKKILEREGRVKMNARERRAPSIGRVLGALKDFTNITREEKIQIIKQIRILSQNAAKSLSKEINELASKGSITPKQVAAVINRFGKVNLLNEISVANFVDYMAKVFNDAEYADKISVAKKQLAIAKKNIETKIGKADGLMIPLRKMLVINPNLIPDSVFNEYLSLVDMFGQRRTVLTLAEKSELTKQVNNILEAVNKEQFEADNLAFVMRESKNVVYNENGTIDFAETLKKMVKEEEITQEDADLMRKYKSDILPQVEPEPKSDKEIEAEKQDLLNALSKTEVQTSGLPSRDERNLANKLAKLIRTDAVKSLTNADLKNLLRVIDNINNNFLPNYASLMVGRLNSINKGKVLDNSITKAIPLAISKFASRVKTVFTGENNPAFEMIKRGPQMSIDEMLGDFKSNNVFKSLFESVSEAASTYKTEIKKIQNILEDAENKIAKSFLRNQEKITMSKYKIMTYLIQLEYESNPNNEQVNPAANYIKETIKLIQAETSQYNEKDMEKFKSILKEYNDGKGGIDNKKLYNSFNPAEKSAIKDIRGINESLAEPAAFTASVIRGDKFNPLNNYVHLNVLSDTGLDESFTPEYMTRFDNSMRPSTKAKSLIERTKGAKALNFDAFASAQRGANFVLMDYNLTPAIREAHITLNQTLANLQQQANEKAREQAKKDGVTDENKLNQIEGVIPQKERRIFNAIRDAFELATSELIQASSLSNSLIDDGVDYITKQGYRTTLAGTGRFVGELLSNLWSVSNIDPVAYYDGVADFGRFSMSENAATFMMNVKSKSTSRLYGSNPLSGRIVDTNILNQASGMKGAKSIGAIENRIMQAWNLSGKKLVNGIELTADALVATPDKVVSIPFWFGSFAKKFKQITGEDIDRQKIVEDNEAYMNKYEDAIREAKNFADNRATTIASTDNPYMNILKGKSKKEQTALTKAFNVFNSFLTNFNIVDFYNLRRGVYSLMGKGMLTKTEGARLISAIAGRSIIYTAMAKLFGDGILGMIGGDDDEKKEDNTWYQILGQAIASTATSAFIGRDFGNAVRLFLNSAIEYGNEKYLDFLRTGPYDRFKDSIQFSAIPAKKGNLPLGLIDFALPLAGPLQPALKTTDFVIKTWSAPDKKEEAAKERQEKNKYIRTPLEIAGNLGAILMYKDVRKLVMKDINKSLIQEQKAAADKKANKLRLLQGFESEEKMKRYEPELWDRTYGPSSEGYDARQEAKRLKREQDKLEQAIEDEERGYTPPASRRRSSSSAFGPQKGGSKSGFGPQNKKSKSSFGPQD